MTYRVTKILDSGSIEIFPPWEWEGSSGSVVRVAGYHAPAFGRPGHAAAKTRLNGMLFAKTITTEDPVVLSSGELLCKVFIDGIDVATFFPEYR